jgi:signal transduction histidine kinase
VVVRVSGAGKLRAPRRPRIALAALVCWAIGALTFAASPEDSAWRVVAANVVYFAAVAFALLCSARAGSSSRDKERLFWWLLAAGSLAGGAGWGGLQGSALEVEDLSYQHASFLTSYLLFFCALLLLVNLTTSGTTFMSLLDSLAIMLSVGILVWYFFPGRMVAEVGAGSIPAVIPQLSFDAALLFLCIVVLSAARVPFVGLLAAGFLAFAVADGWRLGVGALGSYGIAEWPDLFWTVGFVFVGLAALRAAPVSATRQRMGSWRILAFWLGPLSPAIHVGIVLAWGATHPPLPAYASAGGAILLLYLALRIALVSFVTRRRNREREEEIRVLEQERVLYELHDTVKQRAHGITLALRAAMEAERRGEAEVARRMLDRALETSQEAEYHVSEPYDELQAVDSKVPSNPSDYLSHRLKRFEEYFGVETHEDFRVPFELLSPAEITTAQRVFVEASWNAVKHAQARNLWLETRRLDSVVIVRIRDDGRGFDVSDPPPGLGLRYMRRRAGEVGAELDVISFPGRGTTIQLRFDKKERAVNAGQLHP